MSSKAQNRILLYVSSLLLHGGNAVAMGYCLYFGEAMKNPDTDLKLFELMRYRYITIWNVAFHLVYAMLSLCCEIYDLTKEQRWRPYREMAEKFRDHFFCGILWPISVLIFTIFWPLYTFNRELIFPSYIDKVLSQVSNHIMHSAILFIVLWEIAYNPRKEEKQRNYRKWFNIVNMAYNFVIISSYWQFGVFPYPMMLSFTNTQMAAFLLFTGLLGNFCYTLQWVLTPILQNYVESRERKKEL